MSTSEIFRGSMCAACLKLLAWCVVHLNYFAHVAPMGHCNGNVEQQLNDNCLYYLSTEDAYVHRARIDGELAHLDILDTAGQVQTSVNLMAMLKPLFRGLPWKLMTLLILLDSARCPWRFQTIF